MSAEQIEDVALSFEYMKQYTSSHSNLSANQGISVGTVLWYGRD